MPQITGRSTIRPTQINVQTCTHDIHRHDGVTHGLHALPDDSHNGDAHHDNDDSADDREGEALAQPDIFYQADEGNDEQLGYLVGEAGRDMLEQELHE